MQINERVLQAMTGPDSAPEQQRTSEDFTEWEQQFGDPFIDGSGISPLRGVVAAEILLRHRTYETLREHLDRLNFVAGGEGIFHSFPTTDGMIRLALTSVKLNGKTDTSHARVTVNRVENTLDGRRTYQIEDFLINTWSSRATFREGYAEGGVDFTPSKCLQPCMPPIIWPDVKGRLKLFGGEGYKFYPPTGPPDLLGTDTGLREFQIHRQHGERVNSWLAMMSEITVRTAIERPEAQE